MHQYFRSKQIRSGHNKFFNAACVSKDYKEDTVELLYSASMSTIVTEAARRRLLPGQRRVLNIYQEQRVLSGLGVKQEL